MSDLKHQTVEQLRDSERDCEHRISTLGSQLHGQKQRLEWIRKYLYEKTAVEMSIEQIERELGHKVIITE